ncbi:GNAT family N-acetyltransferase [Vineibacter terrae]|uniref:GNAT family N-acetyltransferase n=1 Tax=Vineibacter terrae TaxID=2586908 RepID=A0A5C8PVM0_9HYPH|nr:GNAT family protein [Vineibacter terrae]TXL82368.1 GNAT family N-acetyltransferase [Vineibacter terrae]
MNARMAWRFGRAAVLSCGTVMTLRPFGEGDFDRLISWVRTPDELARWCGTFFSFPLDRAQLFRYVESARQPNMREIFAAIGATRDVVGHIEISMIWPHLSCRLSRVLIAPQARGQGLGGLLVKRAITHAFETHHVDRIDLGVATDNVAAIACYEAQGFGRVGLWVKAMVADGNAIDVCWMTLTRAAWSTRLADAAGGPPG